MKKKENGYGNGQKPNRLKMEITLLRNDGAVGLFEIGKLIFSGIGNPSILAFERVLN